MNVFFIGAGPGAADLITVRGAKVLSACKIVLYAGSLVPEAVLEHAHPDADIGLLKRAPDSQKAAGEV